VSTTPPHPDLRTQVLAAASASPAVTRGERLRRQALAIAAGFALPLAISFSVGWPDPAGRPAAYVATLAVAWLGVGLAATWGGISRGRSMLGRSTVWRALVAALACGAPRHSPRRRTGLAPHA
jgi:hypothetical protein